MQHLQHIDAGQGFDWGRTSEDYAKHRPGPPQSFYRKLRALDVGTPGQDILEIGTGTGVVIRELAKGGARCCGLDISENQIDTAASLARAQGVELTLKVGQAEYLPFAAKQFDVVIANQCWFYFDQTKVIPEIKRVLKPGGALVVSGFNFLSSDPLVQATEQLILKYNPVWNGAGWPGVIPPMPEWALGTFLQSAMFYYDERVHFTRESWKGRIRACRGVAASLEPETIKKFDVEHDLIIRELRGESFEVTHRIDAHILRPIP